MRLARFSLRQISTEIPQGFQKLEVNLSSRAGVANRSIAIDWSIAESQLVDHAWFCIELTRYLK